MGSETALGFGVFIKKTRNSFNWIN
ncbi:MAG: PEP-CTERM sorting domain-containing protein [Alphaproteobacteria bacterium]|nr:PEP-CTERM sorting domain-containing protein [Alphaproteobacteria bacterium]